MRQSLNWYPQTEGTERTGNPGGGGGGGGTPFRSGYRGVPLGSCRGYPVYDKKYVTSIPCL